MQDVWLWAAGHLSQDTGVRDAASRKQPRRKDTPFWVPQGCNLHWVGLVTLASELWGRGALFITV